MGQFVPLVWHAKAVLCFHRVQILILKLDGNIFWWQLTWSMFEIFFISTSTFTFIFGIRKFVITIDTSVTIFFADSIISNSKKSIKCHLPDIRIAFWCSFWYILYSNTIGCSIMHLDTWCMRKRSKIFKQLFFDFINVVRSILILGITENDIHFDKIWIGLLTLAWYATWNQVQNIQNNHCKAGHWQFRNPMRWQFHKSNTWQHF